MFNLEPWVSDHDWHVGKVKIGHVQVLDNFGGSAYPTLDAYFSAKP